MVAVVHVIEERVAGVGAGVRAGREGHDLRQIADGGLAYVAHAVALHVREFIRTGGLHCLTTAERVKTVGCTWILRRFNIAAYGLARCMGVNRHLYQQN